MRATAPLARTLTRRIALITAVIVALNMGMIGVYYGSDRPELESEVVAQVSNALAEGIEGATLPAASPARAIFDEHPGAYAFALVDGTGRVIDAMNLEMIPPTALGLDADFWTTAVDRPEGRVLYAGRLFPDRDDGLRMVFVMTADPAYLLVRALLGEFRQHVWVPILPMALLLIVASALLIRRELAPVARAAAWARAVRPGGVTPPPAGPVPAEVADLVDATGRALDRLAAALEAETRHAAETAHALRTPVAVLTARLDALPPGEATDKLRADLAALSRTVHQVLAAARSEALSAPAETPVDLGRIAESVTAALAPLAYRKGVELALSVPDAPVLAQGSAEAVEVALTNLIENAVLHGGPGAVQVTVDPDARIRVRDQGPGLPPGAALRIFEPFWRAPGAVPGGAGLGLAIVERLQHAQGGNVRAHNAEGGGCEVVLSFAVA